VQLGAEIQADSKLLSGFPFIGHGNTDNNLEQTFTTTTTTTTTTTLTTRLMFI
jgi:hypothetical protein